jgi:hypothetical protein
MAAGIPLLILKFARGAEEKYEQGEILVCEANACRRAGAKDVFMELEGLANGADECSVEPTSCLGACRQAPCALVKRRDDKVVFTYLRSKEQIAAVLDRARGAPAVKKPLPNATDQTRWKQKLGPSSKVEDPALVGDDW